MCGSEDLPRNFMMLKEDEGETLSNQPFSRLDFNIMNLGTLPEIFTVCSSIYVQYLTTFLNFFSIKDVSMYMCFKISYVTYEI